MIAPTTFVNVLAVLTTSILSTRSSSNNGLVSAAVASGGSSSGTCSSASSSSFFNYEVEKRVLERIDDAMTNPVVATGLQSKYRANFGFNNFIAAQDRDEYLKLSYSLLQELRVDLVYFGLEDGTFMGHGNGGWATYREPGTSGYPTTFSNTNFSDTSIDIVTEQGKFSWYYDTCVDLETGEAQNCTMEVGSEYIQCVQNCSFVECPSSDDDNYSHNETQKWCQQYEIKIVTEDQAGQLGFVPRNYHCHDQYGRITEAEGKVLIGGYGAHIDNGYQGMELGNCYYEDRITLVQRNVVGPYAYCGGVGGGTSSVPASTSCNTTYLGAYRSRDYDHRYRSWYVNTKLVQKPHWSTPYPFFTNLELGITYCQPLYSIDAQGRQVFDGVLAIDHRFEDITNFLSNSYKGSGTYIVLYEAQEPESYIVATSTGRKAAALVLADDPSQPCPKEQEQAGNCIVVRQSMGSLSGHPFDPILRQAYVTQREQGYPKELLAFKASLEGSNNSTNFTTTGKSASEDTTVIPEDEALYVVQSSFYQPASGGLEWHVLVITPAGSSSTDAITADDSLFWLVGIVALLGFCSCFGMVIFIYHQRNKRAVRLADWRFTSAFLLGCALLNLSSLALLGENTDVMCMVRMWSFHSLFAIALSPLFVKIWRMWRLVGGEFRQRKRVVTDRTAVMLSLPIIVIQMVILLVFSLTDPSKAVEIIEQADGIVTQHVLCKQESRAFSLVVAVYEGLLLLIGCVLAFITRNMDSQYGEAKLLMFSMYNIAFIGIITTVILYTMDIERTGQIVLMAIGILWGTVFSSAAFVLPRLMRIKSEAGRSSTGRLMIFSEAFSSKVERAVSRVVHDNDDIRESGDSNGPNQSEAETSSNPRLVTFDPGVLASEVERAPCNDREDDDIQESDDSSGLDRFAGQDEL